MASPKFEMELDKNLKPYLVYRCQNPECRKRHKLAMKSVAPGSKRECSCGFYVEFAGDDMRKIDKAMRDLNKTMKSLSK